jgi:hypothetical protein
MEASCPSYLKDHGMPTREGEYEFSNRNVVQNKQRRFKHINITLTKKDTGEEYNNETIKM